jgi:tetratricopeptide (TPR) repeat protein
VKKYLLLVCCWIALIPAFADPVLSYEQGKALQDQEDWYGAIECYQDALHENRAYNRAYQGLAECFYALGEYDEALAQVTRAESFKKNDPVLQNLHAFTLIGLGRLDEASAMFARVLATWPNDVSARFGVAEIDICAGKISAASSQYLDALKRNPENRKALLSLALVSFEMGNDAAARDYIAKALQYHGDSPQVFYYAAYISARDGNIEEAEARARNALSMKPDYDEARELLASILYRTGRYEEVIDICDARISANRNKGSAWYLRTLSLEKLKRYDEALKAARSGLEVAPEDELFRAMAEEIIIGQLPFEDKRRAQWAAWHIDRAEKFARNNMSDQSMYEYRRALKVNPYDTPSRQAYAKLFLNRGYPARYVAQLEFVQSLGKSDNSINDAVESYKKLLSTTVQTKWKIDTLYLDKAHTSIGLYFRADPASFLHPDSERITTNMLAETAGYDMRYKVTAADRPVSGYAEAFRASRGKGEDYFALVSYKENERDIQIQADLYVSKTGAKAQSFSVFRTGNDRYSNALRRLVQIMTASFPMRGAILDRYQADAVIDLGKSDGVKAGDKFDVVPRDLAQVMNEGIGIMYRKEDSLGTFTVTKVDEDASQGTLERNGFFDRVNSGDSVMLQPAEAKDTGKMATTKGNKKATAEVASEAKTAKTPPALLSQLRKIR